jgi:type I restriction enzyme M protein
MMKETGQEKQLPKGYRWSDLEKEEGVDQLTFYRAVLLHLGTKSSGRVQAIYANASTSIKAPKNLKTLVDSIDTSTGTRRGARASAISTRACSRRTRAR